MEREEQKPNAKCTDVQQLTTSGSQSSIDKENPGQPCQPGRLTPYELAVLREEDPALYGRVLEAQEMKSRRYSGCIQAEICKAQRMRMMEARLNRLEAALAQDDALTRVRQVLDDTARLLDQARGQFEVQLGFLPL